VNQSVLMKGVTLLLNEYYSRLLDDILSNNLFKQSFDFRLKGNFIVYTSERKSGYFLKFVNFGLGLTNIHFLFNQIFINWRTRYNRKI